MSQKEKLESIKKMIEEFINARYVDEAFADSFCLDIEEGVDMSSIRLRPKDRGSLHVVDTLCAIAELHHVGLYVSADGKGVYAVICNIQ